MSTHGGRFDFKEEDGLNMKRQTRREVFETNSSSMHSLCIMKNNDKYTSEEISKDFWLCEDKESGCKDCVWNILKYSLEFGRSPFRAIGNFHDKWLYACASLASEYNDDAYKELLAIALKYVPGLRKIHLPKRTRTIENKDAPENKDDNYAQKYGMTEEEFLDYLEKKENEWGISLTYWEDRHGNFEFDAPYTGYVDENVLGDFLEKENVSLEEFLTSKKYVVIQDGDEYCYWADMKESGLVNLEAIDHEYPKD